MRRSEALALIAVLEAACPQAKPGDATRKLYAGKLERYDVESAARGIDALIESWRDWRFPSWPVVKDAIQAELRRETRQELPVAVVPPPPEFEQAWRKLRREVLRRHLEMRND